MLKRSLALWGAVLALSSPVLVAQTTLPANRLPAQATTASFKLGVSIAGGQSNVSEATTADAVNIAGTITLETAQLNQTASIFVVAKIGEQFYMRRSTGAFAPWTYGDVARLEAFTTATLQNNLAVDYLSNTKIPVTGNLLLFLGYKAADGALYYSSPLAFKVTAPPVATTTPLQDAQNYYSSNISTYVQSFPRCVTCHIANGVASSTALKFHESTSSDHISWNVDQFKNLVKTPGRGRTYILNTTLGQNDHQSGLSGGKMFSTTDTGYKNLDTFLQMLEKL